MIFEIKKIKIKKSCVFVKPHYILVIQFKDLFPFLYHEHSYIIDPHLESLQRWFPLTNPHKIT